MKIYEDNVVMRILHVTTVQFQYRQKYSFEMMKIKYKVKEDLDYAEEENQPKDSKVL